MRFRYLTIAYKLDNEYISKGLDLANSEEKHIFDEGTAKKISVRWADMPNQYLGEEDRNMQLEYAIDEALRQVKEAILKELK